MSVIFRQTIFFMMIGIGCALTSCVAVPRVQTPLFEGRQGSISLRVFAKPTQRAQHPVILEPHVIRKVLKGLYVQDSQGLLESVLTNNNHPIQALSEKEIHFLVPHIIAGLEKATPEEEIIFQVHSTPSHRTQYTTGSLYYVDSTVHVIIHGYHQTSNKSPLLSRPSNSFSRPKMWNMSFQPSSALTSDSLNAASQTSFPLRFSVNLSILNQAMKNNSHPISPASPSIHEELDELHESLQKQQQQLEQLKNQLQTDSP